MKNARSMCFMLLFALAPSNSFATATKGTSKIPSEETATPLGQRSYEVDRDDPTGLTKIHKRADSTKGFILHDPNFGLKPEAEVRVRKADEEVARQRALARVEKTQYVPQRLRFRSQKVTGYKKRPRVDFDRERLQIGRVDEPVAASFFQRVFSDASDL